MKKFIPLLLENLKALILSMPLFVFFAVRTDYIYHPRFILVLIYIQLFMILATLAVAMLKKNGSVKQMHFGAGLFLILWACYIPGEDDFKDFYLFPLALAASHFLLSKLNMNKLYSLLRMKLNH